MRSNLDASIKGFKKSMGEDDNSATKSFDESYQDANFIPSPIAPKIDPEGPDEAKNKHKEQA